MEKRSGKSCEKGEIKKKKKFEIKNGRWKSKSGVEKLEVVVGKLEVVVGKLEVGWEVFRRKVFLPFKFFIISVFYSVFFFTQFLFL